MVTISFDNNAVESKYSTSELEQKLSDFLTGEEKKGVCLFSVAENELSSEAKQSFQSRKTDTFLDI